ncbi:hypothetical protein D3C75_908200 [compost metagenome]
MIEIYDVDSIGWLIIKNIIRLKIIMNQSVVGLGHRQRAEVIRKHLRLGQSCRLFREPLQDLANPVQHLVMCPSFGAYGAVPAGQPVKLS